MARAESNDEETSVPSREPGPDTPQRFFEQLRALSEHEVGFVVIGGFAVTLHGFARFTKDVDIVPDPSKENLSRLWDALASMQARPTQFDDFKPNELPVPFTREGLAQGGGDWTLYTVFGRLDVMLYVEDLDGEVAYEELRKNAERFDDLEEVGHPIWVASTGDLMSMKERANRPQDRIDLTAMRMALGLEE